MQLMPTTIQDIKMLIFYPMMVPAVEILQKSLLGLMLKITNLERYFHIGSHTAWDMRTPIRRQEYLVLTNLCIAKRQKDL